MFCFTLRKIERKIKTRLYFVLCFSFFTFLCIVFSKPPNERKLRPRIDIVLSCEGKIFLSLREILTVEGSVERKTEIIGKSNDRMWQLFECRLLG